MVDLGGGEARPMPKPCLSQRCLRGHMVLDTTAWTLKTKGARKMTRPTQMQGGLGRERAV